MCNLETEVLENLICGVSFCFFFFFFLKTTAALSWLFVMCSCAWLVLHSLRLNGRLSWRESLMAETEFLPVPEA